MFIIYINDIDVGLNNLISKFADDTKIGNSVITDHDRISLQEDLRKISEWSQRWEIPLNANKSHVLQVGTRNQKFDYEMNSTNRKRAICQRPPRSYCVYPHYFFQQCKEVHRMLAFINRNFSLKENVVLPLYISFVKLHQEYAVQFWSPHQLKDTAKLEAVQ